MSMIFTKKFRTSEESKESGRTFNRRTREDLAEKESGNKFSKRLINNGFQVLLQSTSFTGNRHLISWMILSIKTVFSSFETVCVFGLDEE